MYDEWKKRGMEAGMDPQNDRLTAEQLAEGVPEGLPRICWGAFLIGVGVARSARYDYHR